MRAASAGKLRGLDGGFVRVHVCVQVADLLVPVGLLVEVADRIGAQQREGVSLGEVIPEHLEADRGVRHALFPEHIDHFAVGAYWRALAAAARLLDDVADTSSEKRAYRRLIHHERREDFVGVEHDEVAQSPCGTHINQMRLKCLLDAVPVLRSHNNNRRLPRDKTFAEKFADGVEEFRIAPVELHRMVVMTLGLGRHDGYDSTPQLHPSSTVVMIFLRAYSAVRRSSTHSCLAASMAARLARGSARDINASCALRWAARS